MGLMADAVVHSKAGRDALEKTRYMKKHTKEMEQEAMDRIQEHMDEVGLSAKHCLMMSWGQWEKLRRILGFQFNPPKNESYATRTTKARTCGVRFRAGRSCLCCHRST